MGTSEMERAIVLIETAKQIQERTRELVGELRGGFRQTEGKIALIKNRLAAIRPNGLPPGD